jgi:acetamidase/formamidase
MAIHSLRPDRANLHGVFSRSIPPVLTIASGDTVAFGTLDAGWRIEPIPDDGSEGRHFEPRDPIRDAGHALTGPITITGARPGMTLAVHVDELIPGAFGWTASGGWESWLNRRLGVVETPLMVRWTIDRDRQVCRNQFGHTTILRPFMGVMGMPPAAPDLARTAPPRATGGNIDCRELVPGSTLYLPIEVEGGLFSTGDGHAAQGDGEVSSTAIECPMERATLTFELLPEKTLTMPRAHTPAGWITFGFHEDLDEAVAQAIDDLLNLMGELVGVNRSQALALASVEVLLRVTQVVNGVKGVHAVLPHEAIDRLRSDHSPS